MNKLFKKKEKKKKKKKKKNCTNNFTCCQAQPITMPIGYCEQIHFYGLT